MKTLALALILVSGVVVAATPKVSTDSDPQAQFSTYKTYYWAMKPQGNSPLMAQRIVDGVDSRLQAKGWQLGAKGDVAVAVHVTTQEKQSLDTFYSGGALGGWGWRGGFGGGMATTQVNTFEEGTLIVDMFDSRTQKAIWRGTATGAVSSKADKMETEIDKSLDKMFAAFPPGSGSGKSP